MARGVRVNAELIRLARLRAGMSLSQVAGSEMSRQAVQMIESGRFRPSMRNLEIIASRLRVPVSTFLLDADEPERAAGEPVDKLWHLLDEHRYEEALVAAEAAVRDAREPREHALAGFFLGRTLHHLRRTAEAIDLLMEARRRFEEIGDPWLAAEAMHWEANARYRQEDMEGDALAEEALRLYRSLQPRRSDVEAGMLERVGTFRLARGDYEQAEAFYEEALRVSGPLRDLSRLSRLYHGLSRCRWNLDDRERSLELIQLSLALATVEHNLSPAPARLDLARVENDYGMMLLVAGQLDRADALFASALDHLEESGQRRLRSQMLLSVGELRQRQGRIEEALQLVHEAIGLATAFNETLALGDGYQQLGQLLAVVGDRRRAGEAFARALEVLDRPGLERRREQCIEARRRALSDGDDQAMPAAPSAG